MANFPALGRMGVVSADEAALNNEKRRWATTSIVAGQRRFSGLSACHAAFTTYHLPPQPARISTALLTLRDQVISPILSGIRSPRETLRIDMQTLLHDLGVTTTGAAA